MQYKNIVICVQIISSLFQYASSESLQCYVCTNCETNYENTIQTCVDDSFITTTSQEPDFSTTDGSIITTTDSPATTSSEDGSEVSLQTTTEPNSSTITTVTSNGSTSSVEEGINTPPVDNIITTTPQDENPPPDVGNETTTSTDVTVPSSIDQTTAGMTTSRNEVTTENTPQRQDTTLSVDNRDSQLADTSDKSSTLKDTNTSNNNHEEIIQEPPSMFTSDKESSTLSEISESQTFTTPDIVNVQTTPSEDIDSSTVTINTEYPLEPIDVSTTVSSAAETTEGIVFSNIGDMGVGKKSQSKSNSDQQPSVQMVDTNNRYAFIRTIREVKNNLQRRPHCVVTSYKEENRTVVARGCSFVQEDDPMKHCNSLLGDNNINLTRCMVCDQNRCNSATKSMAGSMILLVTIIMAFKF